MYVLDSDVLIDVQRGHPPAVAWFTGLAAVPLVPGFVVMELVQDARNARELQQAPTMVAHLPVIWPSEADCARALAHFTTVRLSSGLSVIDSLIAATAIGYDGILYTFNVKHYRTVPGLRIEQPYTR